jgi:predicted transposase YbfD/YdcC
MMGSLTEGVGESPDSPLGDGQGHELLEVLTTALVAAICGAESCADFAAFAERRRALLREVLGPGKGSPDPDTFGRVFGLLDPLAFARRFESFVDDLGAVGDGARAIDGKTLRRAFDRAAGRSPLDVVTTFGAGARVAIAQKAAAGEDATLAARTLLETLALDGLLVTGDAIHVRSGTAEAIRARGGHWLLALDADPAMLREADDLFADPAAALAAFETSEPGDAETRRYRVTHETDRLLRDRRAPDEGCLPGVATLACVEASTTGTPARFYVSSARLTPAAFARAVRSHRAPGSGRHWVLDAASDSDAARAGSRRDNGPENLAILRRLSLNILHRARPRMSVARKRNRAGCSDAFARTIVGQMR